MVEYIRKGGRYFLIFLVSSALAYGLFAFVERPSLWRDWSPDQKMLAHATFEGDHVSIERIRNIHYRSASDYDVQHYDKTYNLNELESVWYVVEPFSGHGFGAAHTLISFGFADGSYVAVSAEIRKEKGEKFSPLLALFRQYELTYVVADERDVLGLRTLHRKNDVFVYPVTTSKEHMRSLFVSMLTRASALAIKPEFYNTLTNTCATNIVAHINEIAPGRIHWSPRVLMPEYSDALAYDIGLLNTSLSLEELRLKYRINERAQKYANDPDFSKRIRE